MNTIVNFELAKLLKEKGFESSVKNHVYTPQGDFKSPIDLMELMENQESIQDYFILIKTFPNAPKISEVVMWLYEKHCIWIWVEQEDTTNEFQWLCRYENKGSCKDYDDKFYDLPTKAYESAIKYTLSNLL